MRLVSISMVGLVLMIGCGDEGGGESYSATIVRTEYGIPHITAEDWGGLGFGEGYAYSQDNFCVLMKEIVRANGESARYFGEEEGDIYRDYVYRFFNTADIIENEFAAQASEELRPLVGGYAAGMNKYLDETGVDGLAEGDEGCRNAEWVRPVTELDLFKVYRKLIVRGGIDPLARIVIEANAPAQSLARAGDFAGGQSLAPGMIESLGLPERDEMGSNMYAIGSEASQTGFGILLGNPHFPWSGPLRWYVSHLTIPGEYNVMGASLQGVPVINVGFNENVAWSHTVSTGQRFTFYELTLLEDDPMKYQYDDEVRDIETHDVTIEVKLEDGTIEERTDQIYMTHYGPVVDLALVDSFIGGWPTLNNTLFAFRDANVDNTRALDQWTAINKSQSTEEVLEALKILGVPWVNTTAADREGTAMYADISTVPHVTAEQLEDCADSLFSQSITAQGLATLNGSRSECEWGNDPETPPGLLGFENLPHLVTDEYVANSNDSYWLSKPDMLLEGYSPLIGPERVEQSFRTRLAFIQAEERIAGTDGLTEDPGFTVELLQQVIFRNRNLAAELTLDDVVTICEDTEIWATYSLNPLVAPDACTVLSDWDGLFDVESVGPALWTEFWDRFRQAENVWAVPFDADDPVHTPRDLNEDDSDVADAVRDALGAAVDRLVDAEIPLDRPWGEVQFRRVGAEEIPIHGGEDMFMFSIITSNLVDGDGRSDIVTGNSYIQTVTWDESDCPDAYALLTYSQSTDPASEHYADQTRLYSNKQWNEMPFCAADIEAAKISEITISN